MFFRLFLIFMLVCFSLFGEDKIKEGERLFQKKGCYACHGIDAKGNASYPSLYPKSKNYIKERLQGYKNEKIKSKRSDIMTPYAKSLSKEEIEKIASYIDSLRSNKKEEGEEFFEDSLYESD